MPEPTIMIQGYIILFLLRLRAESAVIDRAIS